MGDVSDGDGDPVTLGVGAAARDGTTARSTTRPTPRRPTSRARRLLVVSATDTFNSTTVSHRFIVDRHAAEWLSTTSAVVDRQGGHERPHGRARRHRLRIPATA